MKNDGGSAFPIAGENEGWEEQGGMSLRDYFAAAAMQGIAAIHGMSIQARAQNAFEIADAMLAEREK